MRLEIKIFSCLIGYVFLLLSMLILSQTELMASFVRVNKDDFQLIKIESGYLIIRGNRENWNNRYRRCGRLLRGVTR